MHLCYCALKYIFKKEISPGQGYFQKRQQQGVEDMKFLAGQGYIEEIASGISRG